MSRGPSNKTLVFPSSGGGGGGAPVNAQYVTLVTDPGLTDERTLAGEATVVSITDGGAGSPVTVGLATAGVTLAKLANLATARFIGRVTGGPGVPESISGTQATTLLDVFTSVLKGLVPASGGGTVNFLRADGTWVVPPGALVSTIVEVDFGSLPSWGADFTIVDAAVGVGSRVVTQQISAPATGRVGNDAEWDQLLLATAPAAGSFTLSVMPLPGPVVGMRRIAYFITA